MSGQEVVAPGDGLERQGWGQGDSTASRTAAPHSSMPPGAAIRGFQSLSLIGFIFAS